MLSSNYKESLPLSLPGNLVGPYCAANDFGIVVYNLEWNFSFVALRDCQLDHERLLSVYLLFSSS